MTAGSSDDAQGDGQETPTTAGPGRPWRQALAADMRAAIPDASASLVATAVFMAYTWWRVDIGRSELVKFFPAAADGSVFFDLWLINATGWAAMLWAWGTTLLGLLVSSRRPKWVPGTTRTIERLHRTTSLTTIAMTLIHMLVFVEYEFRHKDEGPRHVLSEIFIPLVSGDKAGDLSFWGIGVAGLGAFYLAIILGLSYYFRHRIGVRAWRFAHRFSILVYVLAAWHTFLYSTEIWFDVAVMVLARLLAPLRRSERLPLKPRELQPQVNTMAVLRLGVRLLAVATILVLGSVLITNDTRGHQSPDRYPTPQEIDQSAEEYHAEHQG